jgi:hypothetical protein
MRSVTDSEVYQRKGEAMTRTTSVVRVAAAFALAAGLSAQSLAGQGEPASPNGSRQAATATPGASGGSWSRVQKLKAGREVIIGVSGREPLNYILLAVDDDRLLVVKPIFNTLDDEVLDALIAVGAAWPSVLSGQPVKKDDVAIMSGAIYLEGRRLVNLADVVERIDRAAVTEVRGPRTTSAGDPNADPGKAETTKGAAIGAGIGFGAGAATGAFMGPYPSYCGEHDSSACPSGQWIALGGAIGAGVGALIGMLVGEKRGDESATFYVAPKGPAPMLTDVPWERLRLALPPSLQGADAPRRSETSVRPSLAPSSAAKGYPWAVLF